MGIRSKIKSKLKQKMEQFKVLAAVVHDEANHPGRPQPHMAARNPFWGGEEKTEVLSPEKNKGEEEKSSSDSKQETKPQSEQELSPSAQKTTSGHDQPKGSLDEEEADFWFLKYGDNEGWNETNPGKKK